ncbi:TetR/AcrR family transcriptional regulator [Salicibibacter halophilus]|nr:TetR/AcrR family transcriptional regulator [Salicibibacter halophilus]
MSKREEILKAAAKTVSNVGIGNVTLEQVAEEAGISKGGLLYHFPSKQALLEGMVAYVFKRSNESIAEFEKAHDFSLSYVLSTLSDVDHRNDISTMDKSAIMAIANDRDLLAPMQQQYSEWMQRLRAENSEEAAVIIRLITSGLWFENLFDIHLRGNQDREHVLNVVKALMEEE